MKYRNPALPALLALGRGSKHLRTRLVTDLGTMTPEAFWSSAGAPALPGRSTLLVCAGAEDAAGLLKCAPLPGNARLVISARMRGSASALTAPDGAFGDILALDDRGIGMLKSVLIQSRDVYTVLYLPGLLITEEVLTELNTFHLSSGFLLLASNLRREAAGQESLIRLCFAANNLLIHRPCDSDLETIASCLPFCRFSQPQNSLVMNIHGHCSPVSTGRSTPLMDRGTEPPLPHKLAFSAAQSNTLVSRPVLDSSELRDHRIRGVTAVLDQTNCNYCAVRLDPRAVTFTQRLHAFFDRAAGIGPG